MLHRVETGDQPRHTQGPEDTPEPGSLTNRSAKPVTTGRSFQHPGARPQEPPRAPPISLRCSTAAGTVPAATPPHLLPPQPAWVSQVRRVSGRRRLRTLRAEPGTQPSTPAPRSGLVHHYGIHLRLQVRWDPGHPVRAACPPLAREPAKQLPKSPNAPIGPARPPIAMGRGEGFPDWPDLGHVPTSSAKMKGRGQHCSNPMKGFSPGAGLPEAEEGPTQEWVTWQMVLYGKPGERVPRVGPWGQRGCGPGRGPRCGSGVGAGGSWVGSSVRFCGRSRGGGSWVGSTVQPWGWSGVGSEVGSPVRFWGRSRGLLGGLPGAILGLELVGSGMGSTVPSWAE